MTKMTAGELTEKQRKAFFDHFYEISAVDDMRSPLPFGCPWHHSPNLELEGNTIQEMAANYYKIVERGMKFLADEAEEYREEQRWS